MSTTLERSSYLRGLHGELTTQVDRYVQLTQERFELEGRLEVAERTLTATRDLLLALVDETDQDMPDQWAELLRQCRFVGVRLAHACLEVLKERRSLTTDELLQGLNEGMYRFRTSSPLREINAALLRQRKVRREGDRWFYEETPAGPVAVKEVKEEM